MEKEKNIFVKDGIKTSKNVSFKLLDKDDDEVFDFIIAGRKLKKLSNEIKLAIKLLVTAKKAFSTSDSQEAFFHAKMAIVNASKPNEVKTYEEPKVYQEQEQEQENNISLDSLLNSL